METVDPPSDATESPSSALGGEVRAEMPELDGPSVTEADAPIDPAHAVDLLGDVDLDVKVELGRCRMLVGDVLRLSPGSVVELDKLAGDPVDVFVNERLVARGEVLVVNDNFCVRVNEVLSSED